MATEDWNREFSELVRRGPGEPGEPPPEVSEQTDANDVATSDAAQAAGDRRSAIAAMLVRVGFIAIDHATPDNPAVEVLSELLPAEAEIGLCLTCQEFSSSAPYPFAERTGTFSNHGNVRMSPATALVSGAGARVLTTPRREIVVCTQTAISWTASRERSEKEDTVTLYSVSFRDILGARVGHRHKGMVEVWVEDGPTLNFRLTPESAEALQANVDQAAQSQ